MTHVCTVKIQTKSSEATCLRTNCIHTSHRFKSVCFCHLTGFRVVYCKLCIQLPQALEFQAKVSRCLGIIQILIETSTDPQRKPKPILEQTLRTDPRMDTQWTPPTCPQQAPNLPSTPFFSRNKFPPTRLLKPIRLSER